MKLIVLLIAAAFSLVACSHQDAASGAAGTTNPPARIFTNQAGYTFAIGAFSVGGTNVPLTNIMVR